VLPYTQLWFLPVVAVSASMWEARSSLKEIENDEMRTFIWKADAAAGGRLSFSARLLFTGCLRKYLAVGRVSYALLLQVLYSCVNRMAV